MKRVRGNDSVYQVLFSSKHYPALVTALQLSPLRQGHDDQLSTQHDYYIGIKLKRNTWSGSDEPPIPKELDSVVQLYREKPEEAMWIPMCEELLKKPQKKPRKK